MLKWLQTLGRKTRLYIIIASWLSFGLSLSLLLAGVINDGNNVFAKSFIQFQEQNSKSKDWEQWYAVAMENKWSQIIIDKTREIFSEYYISEKEIQNSLALGFFTSTMVATMALALIIATSLSYFNLKMYRLQTKTAHQEGMFDEFEYDGISKLIDRAENRKGKKVLNIAATIAQEIAKQEEKIAENETNI